MTNLNKDRTVQDCKWNYRYMHWVNSSFLNSNMIRPNHYMTCQASHVSKVISNLVHLLSHKSKVINHMLSCKIQGHKPSRAHAIPQAQGDNHKRSYATGESYLDFPIVAKKYIHLYFLYRHHWPRKSNINANICTVIENSRCTWCKEKLSLWFGQVTPKIQGK